MMDKPGDRKLIKLSWWLMSGGGAHAVSLIIFQFLSSDRGGEALLIGCRVCEVLLMSLFRFHRRRELIIFQKYYF